MDYVIRKDTTEGIPLQLHTKRTNGGNKQDYSVTIHFKINKRSVYYRETYSRNVLFSFNLGYFHLSIISFLNPVFAFNYSIKLKPFPNEYSVV